MDKLRVFLNGIEGESEDLYVSQADEASTLSWLVRVKAFLAFFVVGVVCTVLGTLLNFDPSHGHILFLVFYIFGNTCSLISTLFLMGPVQQLRRMCYKARALPTTLMITFLVLTLCAALWWKAKGTAVLLCFFQALCFIWYGLSYKPLRQVVVKLAI